jgi:hypothetical protein
MSSQARKVIVTQSGVFIRFGNPLIAVVLSCAPPQKCSKCGVLTAQDELTGSVCDDCIRVRPAQIVIRRLRRLRAA